MIYACSTIGRKRVCSSRLVTVVLLVEIVVVAGAVTDPNFSGLKAAMVAAVANAVTRALITEAALGAVDTIAVLAAVVSCAIMSTVGTQATARV
jgi:hypothetical protein